MAEDAVRDDNNVPVIMGISTVDGTPTLIHVNPETGALKIES